MVSRLRDHFRVFPGLLWHFSTKKNRREVPHAFICSPATHWWFYRTARTRALIYTINHCIDRSWTWMVSGYVTSFEYFHYYDTFRKMCSETCDMSPYASHPLPDGSIGPHELWLWYKLLFITYIGHERVRWAVTWPFCEYFHYYDTFKTRFLQRCRMP